MMITLNHCIIVNKIYLYNYSDEITRMIMSYKIKIRLNYSFGPHFHNKISIWSLNFFYLNLVHILENLMQSSPFRQQCSNGVKWSVTCQFMDFLNFYLFTFNFFLIFLKIFKNIKILPRVKLTSCHVAVIVSHVTIIPVVISLFSIWFQYFNFVLI